MGEESSAEQIEATAKTVAECLHRASLGPDESRADRQRIAVWYRENHQVVLLDPHRYTNIDQMDDTSEFDIGRER